MTINTVRLELNNANFDGSTIMTESMVDTRSTIAADGVYRISLNNGQDAGVFNMQTLLSPFPEAIGRPWLVIAAAYNTNGATLLAGSRMGSAFENVDIDLWIDISAIPAGGNDMAVGKYLGPGYGVRVLALPPAGQAGGFFQLEVARIEDNNLAAATAALTTA